MATKFRKTSNGGIPAVATVQSARSVGVFTLTVDTQQYWPVGSLIDFSTYKLDSNNKRIAGSQTDWQGISNGTNTLSSMVVVGGAADAGNAIGDKVQMGPTADWAEGLIDGLLNQHNDDGSHGAITTTGYNQASGTFSVPDHVISARALTNPSAGFVYLSADYGTGNLIQTAHLDTVWYDTGSNFNTSTYTFTAPVKGIYHFDGCVSLNGASAINFYAMFIANIAAQPTANDFYGAYTNTTAGNTGGSSISKDFALNVGDTIKLGYFGSTGNTVKGGIVLTNLNWHLISTLP